MSENFLQLSAKDKVAVLRTAASSSGHSGPLLEKDVWVVWALSTLFESPLGNHLVFKGGKTISSCTELMLMMQPGFFAAVSLRVKACVRKNAPLKLTFITKSRSASEEAAYITGSTYFIDGGLIRNYKEQ